MKTKTLKSLQLIEMVLGVAITALGLSLMMKSGLGQTAVVAFTQNLAFLTQMKSGTLIIIFNCSCVLIQILIQRRQFPKLQLLQVLAQALPQVRGLLQAQVPLRVLPQVPGLLQELLPRGLLRLLQRLLHMLFHLL